VWSEQRQRIGAKPYIALTDAIESVDIDNPEDFEFASTIIDTL
jgi:CMP-N-acetylneuraminic acid synthetase